MTADTAMAFSTKQLGMAREYLANGNHEKCTEALHNALHWRQESRRLAKAVDACPPTMRSVYAR